jgi:GntR family transcriptional repressor for pyruvate dehydrogenase complex
MRVTPGTAQRGAADRAFHVRIAEATGNGALAHAVAGLWDQRRGDLWARTEVHFTAALRAEDAGRPRSVVVALDARRERCAQGVHRHLQRVARRIPAWLGRFGRRYPGRRRRAGPR